VVHSRFLHATKVATNAEAPRWRGFRNSTNWMDYCA
jgi:hypothetical protein